MENYNYIKLQELEKWKSKMRKKPSILNKFSKGTQNKFNSMLPDNYHNIITSAIKNMTQVVLFGSKYTTKKPLMNLSLEERDILAYEKIKFYKNTAMLEGAGTGAGGILIGLTDLPLLLSIKIKLLYELASIYGFDVNTLLLLVLSMLSGFLGSITDSLLGASIQAKYKCRNCGEITEQKFHHGQPCELTGGMGIINNDAVNFLSGLISSIIALGSYLTIKTFLP